MKYMVLVVLTLTLLGCDFTPEAHQITFEVLPPELADCKAFYLSNSRSVDMKVMRCPNSTATTEYKVGKASARVVVIDGVTYEEKHK
jgi:hypothetical protein